MAFYALTKFAAYCLWCWLGVSLLSHRSSSAQHPVLGDRRAWLWVVGGVVVSFVSDLASPEGMSGHFCVGRCLC